MQLLRKEVMSSKIGDPRTPTGFPDLRVTAETPSKKRKYEVDNQSNPKSASYSSAVVDGVQSLDEGQQRGIQLLKHLVSDKQHKQP